MGRGLADKLDLRRTRFGRRMLAAMNILGQILAGRILFRGREPIEVDGHRVHLAGEHSPSPALAGAVIDGNYELTTRRLVGRLLPEGGTFIDVGAHVGLYSLIAARKVGPRGRVFAFEPEPDNFHLLTRNIELNGYRNITAVPMAVCDRCGQAQLFVSRQGNDRHSLFRNPRSPLPEHCQTIATTTLDDFVASAKWPKIDLIKMDIEGAEQLAVTGMRRLIERSNRLHLIVEFAPEMLEAGRTSPSHFLTNLADHNLELFLIEENGTLVPLRANHFADHTRRIRSRGVVNLLCRKTPARKNRKSLNHPGYAGVLR